MTEYRYGESSEEPTPPEKAGLAARPLKVKEQRGETYEDLAHRCVRRAQKLISDEGEITAEVDFLLRAANVYATLQLARVFEASSQEGGAGTQPGASSAD